MKKMNFSDASEKLRGCQEKFYLNEERLYCKYDLDPFTEGLSEVIADMALNAMTADGEQIDHVHYFLRKHQGRTVCCSESFLQADEEEIPWGSILSKNWNFRPGYNREMPRFTKIELMFDLLEEYMPREKLERRFALDTILDWFFVDIDRHIDNYSFIKNVKNGKVRMAPRYDNGAAFRCNLMDTGYRVKTHYPPSFGDTQLAWATGAGSPIIVFDFAMFASSFLEKRAELSEYYDPCLVQEYFEKVNIVCEQLPYQYSKFKIIW
mgnify:CR=1 FL=1